MNNSEFFGYYIAQTDVIFQHILSVDQSVLKTPDAQGRTVHGLLDHQVGVDELYLLRLRGEKPTRLNSYSHLSVTELQAKKHEFMNELKQIFLNEELMKKDFEYTNMEGIHFKLKPSYLLHHLIEHQAHHRGQISLLLKNLGQKPIPSHGYVMHFRTN